MEEEEEEGEGEEKEEKLEGEVYRHYVHEETIIRLSNALHV